MVLHETNNVQTVMAGVRQLLKVGQLIPDKVGQMIDTQIEKMEHLMTALRGLGQDAEEEPRRPEDLLRHLEALVSLAGKGRALRVERRVHAAVRLRTEEQEALSLATLCFVLPHLPPKGSGDRIVLELDLDRAASGPVLRASLSPFAGSPEAHPDVTLAEAVVQSASGRLTWGGDARAIHVSLQLPRPDPGGGI
jgi:hypothetical protein